MVTFYVSSQIVKGVGGYYVICSWREFRVIVRVLASKENFLLKSRNPFCTICTDF